MSRDKHIEIALQDAERYARPHMDQGKVATYIPELAKGDPTKLGICIRTPVSAGTGRTVTMESPLPQDMADLLS